MENKNEITLKGTQETLSEGVAFLLEMEQVNTPPVQNALILNILKLSNHIKAVQLLADQEGRKMLIYLRLNVFGRLWYKRSIGEEVIRMLSEVLPNFSFRVVYDYALFEKSLAVAEKLMKMRSKLGPRL